MSSPHAQRRRWTLRRAQIGPDHLAIVDAERSLDYRALHERTGRCAALLAARGVGAGDRVALLLGNRSAYLELVFAAARIGAIAVPLNARLTAPELRGLLADCTPALLVHEAVARCARARRGRGARAPPRARVPGRLRGRARRARAARGDPARLARPPDDPHVHLGHHGRAEGRAAAAPQDALQLPQRRALLRPRAAPTACSWRCRSSTRSGSRSSRCPRSTRAARVFLEPRFDAARTWQRVAAERITFLGAVPTQLAALLAELEARGPAPRAAEPALPVRRGRRGAGRADPRLRGARHRAEAGLRPDRDVDPVLPRRARRDPQGGQRRAGRCSTPSCAW